MGNRFSDSPLKILSYADDLAVLLSNPVEWEHLTAILQLYSNASNAKINIEKTVVVSLSGVGHIQWKNALSLTSGNIQWHDQDSEQAVRYLGYPLYSSDAQLQRFLSTIYMKIQEHVAWLKQRHLSIKGRSLVANSSLLSRLWHILRVVPAPSTWLDSIRTMIRKYVLSFHPAPSWDTICKPKKYGGLSLIDIHSQSMALKMIYIQHLLRPPSDKLQQVDFATPVLVSLLQLHSGHSSILPLIMFPGLYSSTVLSLRKNLSMPVLAHLLKILSKLPPLNASATWSIQWLLDLPLRSVLEITPNGSTDFAIPTIPLKYLVSDMLRIKPGPPPTFWYQSKMSKLLRRVHAELVNHNIKWDSSVNAHILASTVATRDVDLPFSWCSIDYVNSFDSYSTTWLPHTNHWSIPISWSKTSSIQKASLQAIRRYWHPESAAMLSSTQPRPPLRRKLPYLYLKSRLWKQFWSLPLSPRAFQPWWRLLHGKIAVQTFLVTINTVLHDSPLCRICQAEPETEYHFAVGCIPKTTVWRRLMDRLSLSQVFPNQDQIWRAPLFHKPTYLDPESGTIPNQFEDHYLQLIGTIFQGIWSYHYTCIMATPPCPWVTDTAETMVLRLTAALPLTESSDPKSLNNRLE